MGQTLGAQDTARALGARAEALLNLAGGSGKLAVVALLRRGEMASRDVAAALGWGHHPVESMLSRMTGSGLLLWRLPPPDGRMGRRPRLYRPDPRHPAVRLMLAALDLAAAQGDGPP